jgi:hypothetical protein
MSVFVLIKAVKSEGFCGLAVVAAAFGDVQVTGVLDGRDHGRADGGQVDGLAASPAGRGVFAERHVRRWWCASAGDLDGLAGVRKLQLTDVDGLQGAGLDAAVAGAAGDAAGRYLPPGQGP